LQGKNRNDGFVEIEDRFAGYEVYDPIGQKIGKVDDLFVNEADEPEYIGVKTGLLGTKSTLIPWQIAEVREGEGRIIVAADKDHVKDAPAFDDDEEIIPEFEARVWEYFSLERTTATSERAAAYGDYYYGEGHEPTVGTSTADTDDLRVQRTEEELRVGTRKREAGAVKVRKRVRTDRERMEVPTRREEVIVDRVPVEREASETEIGDEEIRVPVTEEEVVVEKRPVAKEEIRVRKEVVEDTEVVEADVRREEIDIDEEGTRRTP
jgi:uncharacterized protein (TIGR02271 family)